MKRYILAVLALVFSASFAYAQGANRLCFGTLNPATNQYVNCVPVDASHPLPVTSGSGTGNTNLTQVLGLPLSPSNPIYVAPASIGAAPAVTPAAAATLVIKGSRGSLFTITAANQTATAGFLVVVNATSAPVDGAITPLACAALPANGNASISYTSGLPAAYSVGITAILTSGANCFTKTTGVITGFIGATFQ